MCELCHSVSTNYQACRHQTETRGDGPQNPGQQSDTRHRSLTRTSAFGFKAINPTLDNELVPHLMAPFGFGRSGSCDSCYFKCPNSDMHWGVMSMILLIICSVFKATKENINSQEESSIFWMA